MTGTPRSSTARASCHTCSSLRNCASSTKTQATGPAARRSVMQSLRSVVRAIGIGRRRDPDATGDHAVARASIQTRGEQIGVHSPLAVVVRRLQKQSGLACVHRGVVEVELGHAATYRDHSAGSSERDPPRIGRRAPEPNRQNSRLLVTRPADWTGAVLGQAHCSHVNGAPPGCSFLASIGLSLSSSAKS